MKSRILNVGFIGKTNAGKSTLLNSLIGEKISIENKKINTTLESIAGILNVKDTQIIFYDTPGLNFFKTKNIIHKKLKIEIWETINTVDLIMFIIDVTQYNYNSIIKDIKKISEVKKPIIIAFNKVDLINKDSILAYIKQLDKINLIDDFFLISAKYKKGLNSLIKYFISSSKLSSWKYKLDEITDKDDIFITSECTRNALLKYLHKEVPYKVIIKNKSYKIINKRNIKIKQTIEISNLRYKSIILGKNGATIKKIRESSQKEIENILKSKIHLYLEVVLLNAK